ncbi:MAG: hypothetical protein Crog4KO_01230 [Crocinitomicaceae bacterium]
MFENLSAESKVWVYTADRTFTAADKEVIADAMSRFLPQWAAHGNSLFGDYTIERDRFLILAVDESQSGASGCSIDSSVRFIKDLGMHLNIDFFNRLNMVIEKEGALETVHVADLKSYPDATVFNPMITKLADLRANWQVKVSESPFT